MESVKYTVHSDEFYDYTVKRDAQEKVKKALHYGKLVRPNFCELCQCEEFVQAHHIDYGKPLEVKWLCKVCHERAHYSKSPFNPNNNPQTPVILPHSKKTRATVVIDMPLENYLAFKQQCQKEHRPIKSTLKSFLIRMSAGLKRFNPDQNARDKNDHTFTQYMPGIPSLVAYGSKLQEPKLSRIPQSWGEGDNDLQPMGRFYCLSSRDGRHAQ